LRPSTRLRWLECDEEEKQLSVPLEDFYNKTIRRKKDDNDENCGNSDRE
jgi:hypothetical protein